MGLFYETEARKVFCEVDLESEEGGGWAGSLPWGLMDLLSTFLLRLIANDLR